MGNKSEMSWEEAIVWLAQGIINISEGHTTIEKDSKIYQAMVKVVDMDLAIKEGKSRLPRSWDGSGVHLVGYQQR